MMNSYSVDDPTLTHPETVAAADVELSFSGRRKNGREARITFQLDNQRHGFCRAPKEDSPLRLRPVECTQWGGFLMYVRAAVSGCLQKMRTAGVWITQAFRSCLDVDAHVVMAWVSTASGTPIQALMGAGRAACRGYAFLMYGKELDYRDIQGRPSNETFGTDATGMLAGSLGPGEFRYDNSTIECVEKYTRIRLRSPCSVPPILMAPFEILAHSGGEVNQTGIRYQTQFGNIRKVTSMTMRLAEAIRCRTSYAHTIAKSGSEPYSQGQKNGEGLSIRGKETSVQILHDTKLCQWVLGIVRNEFGYSSNFSEVSQSLDENLCTLLTELSTEGDLRINRSSASETALSYENMFREWKCEHKALLLDLVVGNDSKEIAKLAPDFTCVMFRERIDSKSVDRFPGLHPMLSYTYLHSARGMTTGHLVECLDTRERRLALRHRRGVWEAPGMSSTCAAWIYVVMSVCVSGYRCYEQKDEGILEACIRGIELLSILLIAVFGFIKLYIYDDSVLFRLMTGWKALNTSAKMLEYLFPHSRSPEEAEANLTRERTEGVDEQFSSLNTCAYRSKLKVGALRLDGVRDEYLGSAGYIWFGNTIIDYITNELVIIEQSGYGVGHFKKRLPLTNENLDAFLLDYKRETETGGQKLIVRRMNIYRG